MLLFEEVIARLERVASVQNEYANRAYNKSVKIANTGRPSAEERENPKRDESVIGFLNSIMDAMEKSNDTLALVVEDLENSIV